MDFLFDHIPGTFVSAVQPWAIAFFWIYPAIFLMLSMKRFYNDRWIFIFIRFFILMMLFVVTAFILFMIVAMISFLW
jgi:hypothetical protein